MHVFFVKNTPLSLSQLVLLLLLSLLDLHPANAVNLLHDNNNDSNNDDSNNNENNNIDDPRSESAIRDDTVCVTLVEYGGRKCHGPIRSRHSFTALTEPGSPCTHTSRMKDNSVKDQYCSTSGTRRNQDSMTLDSFDSFDSFHQTVYVHNKHCHVGWAERAFSPLKLTYTTDDCTYGYKLQSCVLGPCPEEQEQGTTTIGYGNMGAIGNTIGTIRK